MEKPNKRDPEIATRVKRTAALCDIKPNTIYKIIRGDRENEKAFTVYMELQERESEMIKAVKALVPFI